MSDKQTKRFRKEVKRRVDENFGKGMEALAHLVHRKPRFVPRILWIILYAPLFKGKYLRLIYKHMK